MGDHGYYDDAHAAQDDAVRHTTSLPFPPESYAWRDNAGAQRVRNVMELRLKDLMSPTGRSHRRREPLVIEGQTVKETLRQRLERESRELEVAVTQLANQLAKRTAQLEHLKRFPLEDPFADGDTLQFEKSFPGTPDTKYSYVAHRVNDRWYVTGARSPQNLTWDEFVSWLGLGVDEVWLLPRTQTGRRRKVIG